MKTTTVMKRKIVLWGTNEKYSAGLCLLLN